MQFWKTALCVHTAFSSENITLPHSATHTASLCNTLIQHDSFYALLGFIPPDCRELCQVQLPVGITLSQHAHSAHPFDLLCCAGPCCGYASVWPGCNRSAAAARLGSAAVHSYYIRLYGVQHSHFSYCCLYTRDEVVMGEWGCICRCAAANCVCTWTAQRAQLRVCCLSPSGIPYGSSLLTQTRSFPLLGCLFSSLACLQDCLEVSFSLFRDVSMFCIFC